MPKQQITITVNPTSGTLFITAADYQALLSSSIFSKNPDGVLIQITLNATVYNPAAKIAADQVQLNQDQATIAADTAISQDPSLT